MTQPPYEPNNDQSGNSYPPAQPSQPQYSPAYQPATPSYGSPLPAYGQSAPQYGVDPSTGVPAYPASPVYGSVEPEKKSPILGIVGGGIVLVAGIIFFAFAYSLWSGMFNILGPDYVNNINNGITPDFDSFTDAQFATLQGPLLGMLVTTLIGIVGFVLSIVATAQNKGRIFGIIGIVLGVLAPLSIFIAASMAGAAYGY